MNLLVTGGAGYIGSVVTAHLLEAGHEVTVLDDLSKGHREAIPDGALLVEARVHDADQLLLDGAFDAVVHLAAFSIVADSVAHPDRYTENNSTGSTLLLDAMRAAGTKRIVFSSTAAVYGEPDTTTVDETAPEQPVNPYGESKLATDQELTRRAKEEGLAAISLRYFNVAGAYGRYGERHEPETHLIPLALDAALGRRPEIVVYGTDYPTPDGTCIRDYIHVADIARAHLLALEALEPGVHEVLNLGNGAGYSVNEVLDAVRKVAGRELPVAYGERRKGDPAGLVAAAERARARIGWVPERPDLEEMVADAWRFANELP